MKERKLEPAPPELLAPFFAGRARICPACKSVYCDVTGPTDRLRANGGDAVEDCLCRGTETRTLPIRATLQFYTPVPEEWERVLR